MESSPQLANHRYSAHGIRSTNEESIARQQRRDKHRAERLGAAPEYINPAQIREVVSTRYPAQITDLQHGALEPGERDYVRRRLAHFIAQSMPREIRRTPAEICLAVAEIAASGLEPIYPKITDGHKADVVMERLTQLYTKTAIATAC